MKSFKYGRLRFDRASIPADIADFLNWPSVNYTQFDDTMREAYLRRDRAIRSFVDDQSISISEISRQSGIGSRQIYRLFDRCITLHADGRIFGFRGLIPHIRVKSYRRTTSVKTTGSGQRHGASGAFTQLLERYPQIENVLRNELRKRGTPISGVREVRRTFKKIHKAFLRACRQAEIQQHEYPFNQDMRGVSSLSAHLKRLKHSSFAAAAADEGVTVSQKAWPKDLHDAKTPVTTPYQAVEFDGHKIDVRLALVMDDPFGLEVTVELHRIWILVVIDIGSRAILGYYIALGLEYNKDDVVEAIQAALVPHRRKELKIPDLCYKPSGGFPSEIHPEVAYACWDWFRFDNAKAHLAEHTLRVLSEIVGCWPDAGPIKEPNERPFVERFFDLIAAHLAHRLPGTTGNRPQDVRKTLGDPGSNLSMLIHLEELEQLIDVMISDYNGDPHDGLGGRAPLESIGHFLRKNGGFIRTLARSRRDDLCLLQDGSMVTIRGSTTKGVRPHINFEGVRYSSDVLSNNPALIGRKLQIYYSVKDLRTVKAFFEDGAELGILMAARPWGFTRHALRLRKEILRLRRLGKLRYDEGDDPVEVFLNQKKKQARKNKRAANSYAQAKAVAQKATSSPQQPEQSVVDSSINKTKRDELSSTNEDTTASPSIKPMRIKKTIVF